MSLNPVTDFFALLRQTSGSVEFLRAPELDIVVAALARSGLIRVSVGQTAPNVSQPTTMWFQPAQPSYTAEGVLRLWDAVNSTYALATPTLFAKYLQAVLGT